MVLVLQPHAGKYTTNEWRVTWRVPRSMHYLAHGVRWPQNWRVAGGFSGIRVRGGTYFISGYDCRFPDNTLPQ